MDTPGILWPKFEDQEIGYKLALTGAIKDDLLQMEEIAGYGLRFLENHYPDRLQTWLKVETVSEDPIETLAFIAEKRGLLDRYNDPDYSRAAETVVREIRQQKLGECRLISQIGKMKSNERFHIRYKRKIKRSHFRK